ncbi:hypothetical protein SDC9_163905 [bioreactor metagenome]|uniref:Alanine--tRNA ligase n=1 Tax=bioreactor metagenome TaxID=1076179 RepID=A0A645FRN5_9ZZZZ
MTRKLYWETGATQAEVEVLACEYLASGDYGIRLDQTPFHPQGGGQRSDVGCIGNADVIGVGFENGEIVHYTRQAVAKGIAIAKVDARERDIHSRLHSAGHLIGHALEALHWNPIKAHHWPGEARVVFSPGDHAPTIEVEEVQRLCEQLIAQNLPCRIRIDEGGFRKVGFGDLPPYACGGTHVISTASLKGLRVLAAHLKKGQLTVQYDIQ